MQIPSSRSKGGLLNSVMLSIVGENEADVTLSIQSARTSQQIFQYHAELSHVFNELRDDVIKKKTKNSATVWDFTFFNNFKLHYISFECLPNLRIAIKLLGLAIFFFLPPKPCHMGDWVRDFLFHTDVPSTNYTTYPLC